MCNIASVSVHTSPLAQPGTRDSGGMNVYIRELSRELGLRANQTDIFTRRTDAAQPEIVDIDEHSRVIHIQAGPPEATKDSLRPYLPAFLRGVLAFRERNGIQYDLIHSHYWLSGWVGQAIKLHWQVPHVVMFHTLAEAKNRYYEDEREPAARLEAEREVARAADRVICASENERVLLEDSYGVSPEQVAVIPCGVDLDAFRPGDKALARGRLGLSLDKPMVLYVGRIERLKGIDVLLRAVSDLKSPYSLVVVGGDERENGRKSHLLSLAADLGIADSVFFFDAVPHNELPLYYSAADVCVVPSYYESFGLVALEAMACGVPVIGSRVGGLAQTIQDGETGFLVSWGGSRGFTERLSLLLGNEQLQREMGLASRAAAEHFTWSDVAAQVEDIYHELVGECKGVVAHGGASF